VPLLLRREASVGTISIDGLLVNLEVAANGTTNWDDLSGTASSAAAGDSATGSGPSRIDVGNIRVSDASAFYTDARTGDAYAITNLEISSDKIVADRPFDLDIEFNFSANPGDLGGHIVIRATVTMAADATHGMIEGLNVAGELRGIASQAVDFNFDSRSITFDTVAERLSLGELELSILGVSMSAVVEPLSYSGSPQAKAKLRVAEFSLKELMLALDLESPTTANNRALSRVYFSANATLGTDSLTLDAMTLALDDSAMAGSMSLPINESGALRFDLHVDTINLDDYMAPADTAAAAAAAADDSGDDIEIPVDLIRSLNANGRFRIDRAFLAGMEFTNLELGLQSSDGRLRLHPLTADLYEGSYNGDVRIDASKDIPSISVNETLTGVNLSALARSMFDQDNISGTINGSFVLAGAGRNLASIRQDLDGSMSFEVVDGAWEGTDVWHQLRAARAMFRQEAAPEPRLPARTEFTSISATGTVTDGIFQNDDLLIELPFLRLTGSGTVDLPAAQVNYTVEARVFDNPERKSGMTEAEFADFSRTVVLVRITGPLASPTVRPDIEAVFRQQVEGAIQKQVDKLKDRFLNRLLGGEEQSGDDEPAPQDEDLGEQLRNKLLKDLIGR
jgi:AsmA protein